MKILITGATGFIGQYLTKYLIKNGYDVKIFVRNEEIARKIFNNKVKYIIGDITKEEKIRESLIDVDLVYHLAAIRGESKFLDKQIYFKNNIMPTKLFCKYCLDRNIKIIYLSSSGVNGWQKRLPIDENFPYGGKGLYHWSKIESEREIMRYTRKGLNGVIVRTVIVYGDGDNGFLFKLVNLIENKRFFIIGNGENRIHLLYIVNLIQGLVKIIDNFRTGEIYYMADESPITIYELTKIISQKFDVSSPKKLPSFLLKIVAFGFDNISSILKIEMPISMSTIDILTKDRYYSTKKAKEELGFIGGDVKKYLELL